jgi:hypothetical protein
MAFVYTQLAEDLFQRPDENPLDPTQWTPDTVGGDPLAIVSHLCTCPVDGDFGDEQYTGVVFPDNQYAEITLGSAGPFEADTGYLLFLQSDLELGNSASLALDSDGTNTVLIVNDVNGDIVINTTVPTPQIGDVLRGELFGLNLTVKYNGAVVGTATLPSLNPTRSGITIFVYSDLGVSAFRAGSITQTGGGSAPVSGNISAGAGFATLIKTSKTSVMGTNLGTRIIG